MSATAPMIIKALAPWFGGKRTLADDIVLELGRHSQYFELFAGSLAVILAKAVCQKETVNDLHGDITNLARVVQLLDPAEELYGRLGRVVMSEGLLDDARGVLEGTTAGDEPDVERAYWFFLASWMGRNGTAGTERQDYQIAVRWTKNGGSPSVRFRNAAESIPAWHERLKNVVVLRRDAFQIADRFEDVVETAIYADPPYPSETRSNVADDGDSGAGKGGGGGRYLHEFRHGGAGLFCGGVDDHARLAEILRRYTKARVVVSTYDCPRYRELYEGWTFVPKAMNKNLFNVGSRGERGKMAPEVLVVNGPSWSGAVVA